jgi:hypothetical protein
VRVKNGGNFIMRGGTIGNNVARSKIMAVMTRKCAARGLTPPRIGLMWAVLLCFVFVLGFSGCEVVKGLYGEAGGGKFVAIGDNGNTVYSNKQE